MPQLRVAALACLVLLTACPKPGGGGGGADAGVNRCEVDLAGSGFFAQGGTGSSARVLADAAQAIGGEASSGRAGDVLLQNDRVRVVIEQPGRTIGPILSGGHIVDADVQRAAGEPGRDAFGRMNLIYGLGRLSSVTDVEILSDGSSGGPAIVASTGHDAQHDLLNIRSLLKTAAGLDVRFVVDANKPVPVRTTTYYVLSPGETRVRMLTAFCNDGDSPVLAPLIELMDIGAFELFNPGGCQNGLGSTKLDPNGNCIFESSKWFGAQGDGVAYGMRTMSLADLTQPVQANALLGYGGVVGAFLEGESLKGVLSWTDLEARTRPGTFSIRGKQSRSYLRDFFVARDLAGIHGAILTIDGVATGQLALTARLPDGAAAPGARIAVLDADGTMRALVLADAAGQGTATLAPGAYTVSAALEGRLVGPSVSATITAGQTAQATVQLNVARSLTVHVADPTGAPSPGKVMVFCATAPCPFSAATYQQHFMLDYPGQGAAGMAYVPVSGSAVLTLPPGEYDVVVSRGPEFSTWPDTWPASGQRVDLRTADGTVDATIGRVVDTTGWMSADLHVHAVNSSDSAVRNEVRAADFLAEGIDVLVSTDHDVITDYAPTVRALGAENLMATMIGAEVTSFTHGHFNAFPLVQDPTKPAGGAFDHAGGEEAPTLRPPQLFTGVKAVHPDSVVQLNHPRGGGGVLSLVRVDTDTLKTHGDPADYNMAPAPDATADDTRLFDGSFDLIESANGTNPSFAVLNDWMTFLSRGLVRTTTGVSDSHKAQSESGGYSRTYVNVGAANDTWSGFQPSVFAQGLRTQRAWVTNGPILSVTARKLSGGAAVGIGETLSVAANEEVELTVDVQGLEWMELDRVELYSHAPGREALDGLSNEDWPEGRVLALKTLDPAMRTVEAVPGSASLRRLHLTERFVVRPAADTWYSVIVRGTTGRTMAPLHRSRPIAYSNAILVDADGSGAYDDFPLKAGQPLRAVPAKRVLERRAPTASELEQAIITLLEHRHQ